MTMESLDDLKEKEYQFHLKTQLQHQQKKNRDMKHLIIGSGIIGRATGELLEAYHQDVSYNDIDQDLMKKLKDKYHKKTVYDIQYDYDLYWVCTAEWHVDNVLKQIKDGSKVIIRSTIKPDDFETFENNYPFLVLAHIPEFLREKTAVQDIFSKEYVVVGVQDKEFKDLLMGFFHSFHMRCMFCSPVESSLIKLISNNWLASQISFWNEMKKLCDHFDCNSQRVAHLVTCDPRISIYGSFMLGLPFSGFCLPKDTRSLASVFRNAGVDQNMVSAVIKTNDEVQGC